MDTQSFFKGEKEEKRPSWDEYFKEIVLCTAKRSPCHRLKVGCVLVKDNRIISHGYNGFVSNHPHSSVIVNDHEIATIHAEQNAIIDCAKRGVVCDGAVAYITHFPCVNCVKFLVQSGIKTIYYISDYKNDKELLEKLGLNVSIIKI